MGFFVPPRAIVVVLLHAQKPKVSDPEWEKKWLRMRKEDTKTLDQKQQVLALSVCKPGQKKAHSFFKHLKNSKVLTWTPEGEIS
jgi:hypothetical protein